MYRDDDTPDRRYWTAYDHFKVEQEARAMRREYAYAKLRNAWRRVAVALARAGAQPPKPQRTRPAAMQRDRSSARPAPGNGGITAPDAA